MQTARGAALSDQTQPSATPRRRRIGMLAATAAVVWVVDIVTKILAVAHLEGQPPIELFGGLLTLTFLRNSGAAFGLAQGYTAILAIVMIIVIIVIIRMARRLASTGWAVALGLLLGGALGNLTDRMFREPGPFRGAVVDFLELPNWPVFNIADTGITCAAVLIVLLTFRGVSVEGKRPPAAGDGTEAADVPVSDVETGGDDAAAEAEAGRTDAEPGGPADPNEPSDAGVPEDDDSVGRATR